MGFLSKIKSSVKKAVKGFAKTSLAGVATKAYNKNPAVFQAVAGNPAAVADVLSGRGSSFFGSKASAIGSKFDKFTSGNWGSGKSLVTAANSAVEKKLTRRGYRATKVSTPMAPATMTKPAPVPPGGGSIKIIPPRPTRDVILNPQPGIQGGTVRQAKMGIPGAVVGAIRSVTGKIIAFVTGAGVRMSRKKAVELARRFSPEIAAAVLGVSAIEIYEAIAQETTTKRRRRRGLTSRDITTTKRTINLLKKMSEDVGIRRKSCR